MNAHTNEILESIELIVKSPWHYACTAESGHGMITALAAQAFRNEWHLSLMESLGYVKDMGDFVTKDVPHAACQAVLLSNESAYPERRNSYEALSRHARHFTELLHESLATGRIGPGNGEAGFGIGDETR